jgi:purine-nucleoside/S-methyl-5'-thioadenosine phosphorylase / adenosine deaminase
MREVVFQGDGFELPLLQSEVIPARFRHGFTTRRGGVSQPPFDTLNLGGRWGDEPGATVENRRRLEAAAGGRAVRFARQVHGCEVARARADAPVEAVAAIAADAVVTDAPGTAVGVYVADCVPILVADTRTGACAAVHAGWRGTVAGVLGAALRRMTGELGSRATDLRVAIGPGIGACCFEVGPEVVAAVEAAFPGARAGGAILPRAPRAHVDLAWLNRTAAEAAGVPRDAIDAAGVCTRCDAARFFSYRREGGRTGQLAAFVAFDPAGSGRGP